MTGKRRMKGGARTVGLLASFLLLVLVYALASGCGSVRAGVKYIDDVPLPSPSAGSHIPPPAARGLQVASSHQVILLELANSSTVQEARQAFAQLREGDVHTWLLQEALCSGFDELADQPANVRFSTEGWRDFLYGFPQSYASDVLEDAALEFTQTTWITLADDALTTMELSQINPQAARWYLRACVFG